MVRFALWSCLALLGGCAWISDLERAERFDVDGDGVERPADCDDADPSVAEVQPYWTDADGDGFGAIGSEVQACHPPAGAVPSGGDCDDLDATVNPGAAERCNGGDDDCDGTPDQGLDARQLFADPDEDGFGDGPLVWVCGDDDGYAVVDGDCANDDPSVNPGAEEVCNGVDDDCDDATDLDDPSLDPALATWFVDADADGFGDEATVTTTCAPAPDQVQVGGDCDDANDAVSPGLVERCNGLDDDCDGVTDEDDAADAPTWYVDLDRDGYGAPLTDLRACLRPLGYVGNALDCDDSNSLRKPGAVEVCDGIDNDCDTKTDDADTWVSDPRTWYQDADGDGFGTTAEIRVQCARPAGFAERPDDCRDDRGDVNPGALERCDLLDNDCDGAIDDADDDLDLLTTPSWYVDADGDGYGDDDRLGAIACVGPPGLVNDGTDCDDTNPGTFPGARELCDARDNDCDSLVDEDTPTVWYRDLDGDGFGDPGQPLPDCNQPPGYVLDDRDCDDGLATVNPAAPEVCDGLDSDCDGLSDDEDPDSDATVWYADLDDDGFGDPFVTARGCAQPVGFLPEGTDCDDGDPTVSPGSLEVCDNRDNDCDGFVDDADPEGANPTSWYLDGDLDGFGDDATVVVACFPPYQHVAIGGDCDDAAPSVNPAATEVCGGRDDDCDGRVDDADPDLDPSGTRVWHADDDGDGFGDPLDLSALLCEAPPGFVADGTDCDDTNPSTWPGAAELCDLQDNDCDAIVDEDTPTPWYADDDGDGFGDLLGVIADCDPVPGHVLYAGDCDDTDPAVNPGAPEVCNGVDDDCDLAIDDADRDLAEPVWYYDFDGDGFGDDFESFVACVVPPGYVANAADCDDGQASVNPSAVEICNLRDDDCDGRADDADPGVQGTETWYADVDGDGYGDPSATQRTCAQPPLSTRDASDCDDTDFKVHPDAAEICDSVDNDCDLAADDADPDVIGQPTWYTDLDDDGFGVSATAAAQCTPGPFQVSAPGDCDDTDPTRYPAAPEECDGDDDDCDGATDEAPLASFELYVDLDLDGYGDPATRVSSCVRIAGKVLVGTDCDDTDPAVQPLGDEVCDGVDNDCDARIDDADLTLDLATRTTWFTDGDNDGFGDDATAVTRCDAPPNGLPLGGDCDDGAPDVNPLGTEAPGNAVDEDCSGDLLCYVDADRDGFGDDAGGTVLSPDLACLTAAGEALVLGDCDDTEPLVNIGNVEIVGNALDDDCSGDRLCFVDLDGDGFGDASGATVAAPGDGICDAAEGQGANALDCDDGDAAVNPGETEVAGNEIDEDCSGDLSCFVDLDQDGFGDDSGATSISADLVCATEDGEALSTGDCDDTEPLAYTGASEVCDDGVDNDCDGRPGPTCRLDGARDIASVTRAILRETLFDGAGRSVAIVGDLTGDGEVDLVVGGADGAGTSWVVPGPVGDAQRLTDAFALSGAATEQAGWAVAGAGDVNGDGHADLISGAPDAEVGGLVTGAVVLTFGPVTADGALAGTGLTLTGTDPGERFGQAVAGPANFDGDGLADFVVGAPASDHLVADGGATFVFTGATVASGAAETVARSIWANPAVDEEGGACVSANGDLDGDGLDDILTGSPGTSFLDGLSLEHGIVDVILDVRAGTVNIGLADAHFQGTSTGQRVGAACAIAKDLDGDGRDDALVGAPDANGGDGRAYLFLGASDLAGYALTSAADATFTGSLASRAGASLVGPGDLDQDGFGDLAIGAPDDATGAAGAGAVYLLYGGALSGTIDLATADLTLLGDTPTHGVGHALAGGDLDQDGKADLLVGTTGEGGQSEAAYVLFGQGL